MKFFFLNSRKIVRFEDGHSNKLARVHNRLILILCKWDSWTQIFIWGGNSEYNFMVVMFFLYRNAEIKHNLQS